MIWIAIWIGAAVYAAERGLTYAACVAAFMVACMVYAIYNDY